MNRYLKISEVAAKWRIKERRINTLYFERRIAGAIKFGNTWAIPEDVEKSKDERIKSGKYIKRKKFKKSLKTNQSDIFCLSYLVKCL